MPKNKSELEAPKKKAVKHKTASSKTESKKAPKSVRRAKPVFVDVIEDDDELEEIENETPNQEESFTKKTATYSLEKEDFDIQKNFFQQLSSSRDSKKSEEELDSEKSNEVQAPRKVGLYRRLVIKFLVLLGLIAIAVVYFSFSKLTVNLELKGETISDNMLFKVSGPKASVTSSSDPRQEISGSLKMIDVEAKRDYLSSGESYQGEEIVGRVRIINNYNKSQALVATTRLLSPDNKLFRIKEAVNVPAGGEVSVDIYADKPSEEMAIAPTDFTIPGLWAGLQDKIYAKSDTAFEFTKKVKKFVTADDIRKAKDDIADALLQAARLEANNAESATSGTLFEVSDNPESSFSAKAGEAVESFSVTTKGKVLIVSYSKDETAKMIQAKLNLILPDDKELSDFDSSKISYVLDNYDQASDVATIKADFSATMILKSDAEIIDPRQLIDLSEDQISAYLKSQPAIKDFNLEFFPAFIKKAPSLCDRIEIKVK